MRPILEMNSFARDATSVAQDGALRRRLENFGATSVLFYQEPIEMMSALGAWMTAADGTRYLDCYNNVLSIGHCHPQVTAAIAHQSSTLNINTRYLSSVVDDYLDALKARLPASLSNVALACSGSEANDLALRVAGKVTGCRGVVVTASAYHGNTAAVTAISPSALKRDALPDHVVAVPAPSRAAYGEAIAAGFGDAVEKAIDELRKRGHGLSAFICDSIFSSDGVHAEPGGFLATVIDAVHAHGGLYVADEVQPGFARTGQGFWGFEHHAVTPDMVTMGKPMGNGYPIAGLAAPPDYFETFCEDVGYFNTFGGNPVAAAAGHAVLRVIDEEGLQQNASLQGALLLDRLRTLAERTEGVADVRGLGLFLGVELSRPGEPDVPDPERTARVIAALRHRQVLIGAAGRFGQVLKIRPPLCLDESEAGFFMSAMEDVLEATPPGT